MEDMLLSALTDERCGCPMAVTSDNLANKYSITREDQDAYACRSHQAGAMPFVLRVLGLGSSD